MKVILYILIKNIPPQTNRTEFVDRNINIKLQRDPPLHARTQGCIKNPDKFR